jgi:hypothetical protein
MGKRLLVALAVEGKFASEGLQAIDGDDDMLTAMARELVENRRFVNQLILSGGGSVRRHHCRAQRFCRERGRSRRGRDA